MTGGDGGRLAAEQEAEEPEEGVHRAGGGGRGGEPLRAERLSDGEEDAFSVVLD